MYNPDLQAVAFENASFSGSYFTAAARVGSVARYLQQHGYRGPGPMSPGWPRSQLQRIHLVGSVPSFSALYDTLSKSDDNFDAQNGDVAEIMNVVSAPFAPTARWSTHKYAGGSPSARCIP